MQRAAVLFFLGAAASVATAAGITPPSPWESGLTFEHAKAAEGFAALHAKNPQDARIAIAYASTLLVLQPRTSANIDAAYALLKTAAVTGAPEGDAVIASYLLARVEQDHLSPADPDRARTRYEALLREHPAHPLAGQAAVQLALLDAWAPPRLPVREAVARIESLLAASRQPAASRELHFILARLQWEDLHDATAAIAHLSAGRELGYEKPFRNAEVDLMIAGIAYEHGDRALALKHYRSYIAADQRNSRTHTIRTRITELETELGGSASASPATALTAPVQP